MRPIAICAGMSRRSTNVSLHRALVRAVELPIGIAPHIAGALGDRMCVNVQCVRIMAAEALLAQSEAEELAS